MMSRPNDVVGDEYLICLDWEKTYQIGLHSILGPPGGRHDGPHEHADQVLVAGGNVS
jgi:hypothetical protein